VQVNQSDLDHLRWFDRLVHVSLKDKAVLDLGCGSGHICRSAIERGAQFAVGVDVVKPKREAGAEWKFVYGDLDSASWHGSLGRRFNLVTAFDIIEHLRSPFDFLVTCGKLLEPEGLLVLTTVNVDSWERLIRPGEWSGATDAQHKILFTKYSLAFLLARTGFSVNVMAAPIRKIEFLGALQPGFGGQLFCVCKLRKQA
jgi:2-polyprenyl-3-methyl-5-hydroxy-6-metoxy-1,4-benzoquinol methylase